MAILGLISATYTASSVSSRAIPNLLGRQSKITLTLPKKKLLRKGPIAVTRGGSDGLSSNSTAPTPARRPRWWGEEEDPLTSDDFIWNRDFMDRMKKLVEDPDQSKSSPQPSTSQDLEEPGFLNLSRVMRLNSLDIDLSKELTSPSKPILERSIGGTTRTSGSISRKWRPIPIQFEKEKWDKSSMASASGTNSRLLEVLNQPQGDPEVLAAQSLEQYYKLKTKLQILTLGIGGTGLISAYVSYSPEVMASFGAGLLGSLVYMRLLGNSVDAVANRNAGLMRGGIGPPRLLVPVILVMVFNRWNEILVPNYGLVHLEMIPMLVGFFTYKIATFLQAVEDAIAIVGRKA